MYDLKHDFVLSDLDDFAAEKSDLGVGQGSARLKFSFGGRGIRLGPRRSMSVPASAAMGR